MPRIPIKELLIKLGILNLLFLLFMYVFIVNHEITHQQIYEKYGVDSKITIGLLQGYTQATSGFENLTSEQINQINAEQNSVENIGYQVSFPLYMILSVLTFLAIVYAFKPEPEEKDIISESHYEA